MKSNIKPIEFQATLDPEKAHYEKSGMCHRCEYRALFFETGTSLQPQCGEISISVQHCTTWRPVRPVVIKLKDKEPVDPRTVFSNNKDDAMRLEFVRVLDMDEMRMRVIGAGRHMTVSWMR
jgi:hypothetical protein